MSISSRTLRVVAGVVASAALVAMAACSEYRTSEWSTVRDSAGNLKVDRDGTFQISVDPASVEGPLEEFAESSFQFGPKNGGAAPKGKELRDTDRDGKADELLLSFDLDDLGFDRSRSEFVEQDACLKADVAEGADYQGCQTIVVPPIGYVSPSPTPTTTTTVPPSGGGGGGGPHPTTTTTTTTTTPPPSVVDGWSQATLASSPVGRMFYGMAPDPVSGVVLFGGYDDQGFSLDDTWRFDGSGWTQLHPVHDPGLRNSHAMAGDGSEVVLFGGFDDSSTYLDDTWVWDGTDWTLAEDGTHAPSARIDAGFAPLGNGSYLLFGGLSPSNDELDDTWLWDGSSWTELSPATSPPARAAHTMALDPQSGDVIVHGGVDSDPSLGRLTFLEDTWAYDLATNTWTQVSVGASAGPRSHAGMAAVGTDGPLVIFGGYSWGAYVGTTYVFEGGTWVQHTGSPVPEARSGHDLVTYGGADGYAVLFGGSSHSGTLADTWRFADR